MDINRVYLCKINRKNQCESEFVCDTVVYKLDEYDETIFIGNNRYYDLINNRYYSGYEVDNIEVDELYIDLDSGFIKITDVIDFKEEHLSRRKILKKYNEYTEEN